MKLTDYLFKKPILLPYTLISAFISLIFVFAANVGLYPFWRMLPIVLLLLLILRTSDDIFDYKKDSEYKIQFLSKKQLIALCAFCSFAFVVLNVVFFKQTGLISILLIAYIFVQERFELLKILYMALLFLFYFYAFDIHFSTNHIIAIALCFLASTLYFIKKRKAKR